MQNSIITLKSLFFCVCVQLLAGIKHFIGGLSGLIATIFVWDLTVCELHYYMFLQSFDITVLQQSEERLHFYNFSLYNFDRLIDFPQMNEQTL